MDNCIYATYDAEGKHCTRQDMAVGSSFSCRLDFSDYENVGCVAYKTIRPKVIDRFDGDYAFLSNFFECPVFYNDLWHTNSEAAFQGAKSKDRKMRGVFSELSPSRAKYLGRHIQLREDWEQVKDTIMEQIVYNKFRYNASLEERLLDTGTAELIEGNTWGDTYWGICNGVGQNKLGKILMKVRERLREEEATGEDEYE